MPVYEALGPVIRSAAAKDLRGNAVKLRRNGAERAIALHALVGADLAAATTRTRTRRRWRCCG